MIQEICTCKIQTVIHQNRIIIFFLQIDNVLNEMIPDASLFSEVYERTVEDDQHIAIRVIPINNRPLSTKDFKTVVSGSLLISNL